MRTVKPIDTEELGHAVDAAFSTQMEEPDPRTPIPSIHERRSYIPDQELTDDQIGLAGDLASLIDIPVRNVIMRIDTMNNEVAALSYLSNEAWRLAFKAGESPGTDEHAFYVAPVMRRICQLSSEVAGLLSKIGAQSDMGTWRHD